MPTYQYRCKECRESFTLFMTYEEFDHRDVHCPHCQSPQVDRVIGSVRVAHSSESRLEDLADPASLANMEDDPKAMGKMMRQMSDEMGEDLGPEFDEVVDRLERGQSPEEIEKDLPALGSGGEEFDNPSPF